jgi:uroporphyrinogen decarboxylase
MTSRFLDACRRRPTDVRPVWFMRQAGRYMKQYRDIRAHHSILEICKRPDLAAQVTLQPVEILDVDAAIIFADLLLPVEPMGLKLRFAAGEGPVIDNPVRTSNDVDSLSISNTDDLGYVGEAIQRVVAALARAGDRVRGGAIHHGQLHDRRRALQELPAHQADDVPR